MKTLVHSILLAALVLVGAAAIHTPDAAQAQGEGEPQYICDYIDEFDGFYDNIMFGATVAFRAGERLTLRADLSGGDVAAPLLQLPATFIYLDVAGVTVDTDGVPGVLTYTFAADTMLDGAYPVLEWGVDSDVTDVLDPQQLLDLDWDASCDTVDEGTIEVAAPGCDVLINLPATAVVGTFVNSAPLYYAPGMLVEPYTELEAGKTAWVLGVDASGGYYKILWGCSFVWVPVGAMGPNYDAVWGGMPLPTGVVN